METIAYYRDSQERIAECVAKGIGHAILTDMTPSGESGNRTCEYCEEDIVYQALGNARKRGTPVDFVICKYYQDGVWVEQTTMHTGCYSKSSFATEFGNPIDNRRASSTPKKTK